jgi:hypothetical protein
MLTFVAASLRGWMRVDGLLAATDWASVTISYPALLYTLI